MNYESLYKDFKMLFADELTRINQIESINGIDSTDGIHVAFGMADCVCKCRNQSCS